MSAAVAEVLPLAVVPGINSLAAGLVTGQPDVTAFLPDPPTLESVTRRASEVLARFRPRDPAHADPELRAFTDGRVAGVVAGQQAGLFTGPLLTLVKAIAARKLAEAAAAVGAPAQALFWCASEDHDLAEVTRVPVPEAERMRELGPPAEPLAANRRPIGALPIELDVRAVLEQAAALIGQPPDPEAYQTLERLTAGRTYAQAFVDTLRWLLGEPQPVADAARAADKPDLLPLAERLLTERQTVKRLLDERAARLVAAGHPLQVTGDPQALPLFALVEGERYALHAAGERIALKGKPDAQPLEVAEVLDRFRSGAWLPSFSALTRPLAASVLYPVAASVLGPAEIAYWAQAHPLFAWAGVVPPVVVPRPMVALIEPSSRRLLDKLGLTLPELLEGADAVLLRRGAQRAGGVLAELADVKAEALARLDALGPRLQEVDGALAKALETTRGNIRFALEKLEERVAAAAGRSEEVLARQVQRLAVALAPDRRLAERAYTPLHYLLRYGRAGLAGPILAGLRWDTPGVQLLEL